MVLILGFPLSRHGFTTAKLQFCNLNKCLKRMCILEESNGNEKSIEMSS